MWWDIYTRLIEDHETRSILISIADFQFVAFLFCHFFILVFFAWFSLLICIMNRLQLRLFLYWTLERDLNYKPSFFKDMDSHNNFPALLLKLRMHELSQGWYYGYSYYGVDPPSFFFHCKQIWNKKCKSELNILKLNDY